MKRAPVPSSSSVPARIAAALLFASLTLTPRAGRASPEEDRARARDLAEQGKAALARRDYAAAADLFRSARALVAAPTLELGRARAEVGLGHLREARAIYAEVAKRPLDPSAPSAFTKAASEANEELRALDARMPALVLSIRAPAHAPSAVTLDGAPVPPSDLGAARPVNPGLHLARASLPGGHPVEVSFTASEGTTSQVQLDLTEGYAARGRRIALGFGAAGLGAGALVLGVTAGGLALRDRGALQQRCPGNVCAGGDSEAIASYDRFTKLAWPAIAVGAVGLGGGLALALTSLPAPAGAHEGAPPSMKVGPALLGLGVGALAVGAVSGFATLGATSAPPCGLPSCTTDRDASLRSLRALTISSLAVGFVAAVPGAVFMILGRDPVPLGEGARRAHAFPVTLTPRLGLGSLELSGRF